MMEGKIIFKKKKTAKIILNILNNKHQIWFKKKQGQAG